MTLAAPQDLRLPGMTMDPPSSTGLHSWPLQQRPEPQPVAPRTSSLNTTSDAPRVPASWVRGCLCCVEACLSWTCFL